MDHLAKRDRPYLFPLRVRCVCGDQPYVRGEDWRDWATYPERMGWTWQDVHAGSNSTEQYTVLSSEQDDHNALLQRWLWFGILEEVTTIHPEYSDFVLTTNQLQRPLTVHEVAHIQIRDQLRASGLTDLPEIPIELDSIPPGPILTTVKLNDHLLAWRDRMANESTESRGRHCTVAWSLLRSAQAHAEKMCTYWNGSFALDEPRPIVGPLSLRGQGIDQAIIFSVLILIETLLDACAFVFGNSHTTILDYGMRQPEILIQRFKKAKWCPNRIVWATSLGLRSAYVLSSSGMGDRSELHEACTHDRCNVNFVDESNYETKHRFDCRLTENECPHSDSDSFGALTRIVAEGQIPIVYFDGTSLEVVPLSGEITAFTAISHVWSDGLGNVEKNSLPKCQLDNLQLVVDNIVLMKRNNLRHSGDIDSGSAQSSEDNEAENLSSLDYVDRGYLEAFDRRGRMLRRQRERLQPSTRNFFWIDTLCIPLRPSHLRKLAIRQITEIFQKAAQVVVVDHSLEISPHPNATSRFTILHVGVPEVSEASDTSSTQGLLVQLSCSPWMRRLWTFSEGALATELYVPLSGGCILYDKLLWGAVNDQESTIAGNGLRSLADGLLAVRMNQPGMESNFSLTITPNDVSRPEELRFPTNAARKLYDALCNILDAMSIRSTTKLDDESICIASALDLALPQLQDLAGSERRMIHLLQGLCFVPAEILFMAVKKLESYPRFSWAPSSFMTGGFNASLARTPVARVTDSGLLHQGRAFTFSAVLPQLHPIGFMFKIRGDQTGFVFHAQKRTLEPWDASREYTECNSHLFQDEILDRLDEEWARLPPNEEDIQFTEFVLFTAVTTLGAHARSIGALASIVEVDSSEDDLTAGLTDLSVVETDLETGVRPDSKQKTFPSLPDESSSREEEDDTRGQSPPQVFGNRAITVKYEYAVTITSWPESRFGDFFDAIDTPGFNPMSADFGFVAGQTSETQMWCIT